MDFLVCGRFWKISNPDILFCLLREASAVALAFAKSASEAAKSFDVWDKSPSEVAFSSSAADLSLVSSFVFGVCGNLAFKRSFQHVEILLGICFRLAQFRQIRLCLVFHVPQDIQNASTVRLVCGCSWRT